MDDLYQDPIDVVVTDGAVVLFGPGSLSGAFTPDAAEQTARALLEAAEQARAARH
ncbi:osmotically-inducible protein OsmY [Brevundimonas alba]|uniref:Osmotically-inducible protein OsmY n=1 Tax=Brevundimonas alba TaxID=74314 RepID=A0A7X5YM53_9CAUL|nr:hypothetical protein [Brevundimonas alba]NJC42432.1 osmotically-inducible protein OsmY [Brevundimonas alba]